MQVIEQIELRFVLVGDRLVPAPEGPTRTGVPLPSPMSSPATLTTVLPNSLNVIAAGYRVALPF